MVKLGKEKLNEVIRNAKQYPIEGVFTANDLSDEVEYILKNGYPKTDKIGYSDFDKLITWRKGEFLVVTGTPGAGKSSFLDQIFVRLAARCDWRFAICSPEQQPSTLHIINLMKKYVGLDIWGQNKMNELQRRKAMDFVNSMFFFLAIDEMELSIDAILGKARELVLRKGVNALLIDPWNYIEHKIPKGYSETQYISEVLTKIKRFTRTYNCSIILVAHPTKVQKDKQTNQYEVPNLYSISGSAHFFNKADNGLVIWRDYQTNQVVAYVQKIRFSFVGKIGMKEFKYDPATGRYSEPFDEFESELLIKQPETTLPIAPSLTPIGKIISDNKWIQPHFEEETAPF